MKHLLSARWLLAVFALGLGLAAPADAQNAVFINQGVLKRFSGSLFGSGVEPVPIATQDQAAMQSVYQALKPHLAQESIYNMVGNGACGQSTDDRSQIIAGALPPGWRVDKIQSQDPSNILNGTGHVLTMVTSPDGNYYAVDTYMGVCEIAPMDKQPGYRWNPKPGEEIAGLNATFAIGNFSGTVTYASDGCHYVVTDKGVEKYSYDNGSWIPSNRGQWYTPQIIGLPPNPPKDPPEENKDPVQINATTNRPIQVLRSYDPNEIVGPGGVGTARFLTGGRSLGYTVTFENKAAASAPAADVVVTDVLDPAKYDLNTFRLGAITVGSQTLTPPDGTVQWSTVVDLRPTQPVLLHISTSLDVNTGTATWRFNSVDPATGEPPTDPLVGFLPPNATSPQGEGAVTYSVQPKAGLATGTALTNQASIVFDVNDPIVTNTWTNTIDAGAPTSRVKPLSNAANGNIRVSWEGTDDTNGSGVASYAIYVAKDGGSYQLWLPSTSNTSGVYQGEYGRSYGFFSVATDAVGNVEGRLGNGGNAPTDATSATGAPLVLPAGLNFIGLPVMPDQTDPLALFGFTQNRWARWKADAAAYVRYPDAAAQIDGSTAGQAFWIALDQSISVPIPGRLANRVQPVPIPLKAGWNAIASPYLSPVTWDTNAIQVAVGTETKTLADAATAGWVASYAWAWQPQLNAYGIVYDPAVITGALGTIDPWRGYFILANQDCSLLLPVPSTEGAASRKRSGGTGWLAGLRVQAGLSTQQVYFGLSGLGEVRAARAPAPPTGDSGLLAVFERGNQPLALDIRRMAGATSWDLLASAPADSTELVLSWPSFQRQVPQGLIAELTDLSTGQSMLLNTRTTYRCQTTRGETRRFRLTVRHGTIDRAQITSLSAQSTRGGATTVQLTLSSPAQVSLVVRGVGGRAIKTVAGQSLPAGPTSLSWDGTDDQGRHVPAGTYVLDALAISANGALSRATRVVHIP